MRYEQIDNISFTNRDNKTIEIKDIREYPSYEILSSLKISSEDKFDEIASRPEIYGEDSEDESYKIVDFNIVKLFDNDFDLSKIQRIDLPI